ncbi:MAG: hypothetical protein HYW77_02855 [Parcubacteria group bacterium]|nr:hypothetical protein [Parcubacteria group bacterium]
MSQGNEQYIKIEPYFQTKIATTKKELENIFALVTIENGLANIFLVHGPNAISYQAMGSFLFCMHYGSNNSDVDRVDTALMKFVSEFSDTFSSRDISPLVLTRFLAEFKKSRLENKDSKGLAVESMVFCSDPDKDGGELYYIDFMGNVHSIFKDIELDILLGAYNNDYTDKIKSFLKERLDQNGKLPPVEEIRNEIQELFSEMIVSEVSFIVTVTEQGLDELEERIKVDLKSSRKTD